jgi:hypothetical protein
MDQRHWGWRETAAEVHNTRWKSAVRKSQRPLVHMFSAPTEAVVAAVVTEKLRLSERYKRRTMEQASRSAWVSEEEEAQIQHLLAGRWVRNRKTIATVVVAVVAVVVVVVVVVVGRQWVGKGVEEKWRKRQAEHTQQWWDDGETPVPVPGDLCRSKSEVERFQLRPVIQTWFESWWYPDVLDVVQGVQGVAVPRNWESWPAQDKDDLSFECAYFSHLFFYRENKKFVICADRIHMDKNQLCFETLCYSKDKPLHHSVGYPKYKTSNGRCSYHQERSPTE